MKQNSKFDSYYEAPEFNLASGSTNVPLSTLGTSFLSKFGNSSVANPMFARFPTRIVVRTNQTITFSLTPSKQLSSPGTQVNDPITVTSTDSPFTIDGVDFSDVLFTNNSGSIAAVKLFISDSQY